MFFQLLKHLNQLFVKISFEVSVNFIEFIPKFTQHLLFIKTFQTDHLFLSDRNLTHFLKES